MNNKFQIKIGELVYTPFNPFMPVGLIIQHSISDAGPAYMVSFVFAVPGIAGINNGIPDLDVAWIYPVSEIEELNRDR